MPLLGVNIDHVATVRQARYRDVGGGEPDIVEAAGEAVAGGADIITVHLREDRRHINDEDLSRLVRHCRAPINLEMGATGEMRDIAVRSRATAPHLVMCTLVPEGRQEVTTEGGLNVVAEDKWLRPTVAALKRAGLRVSAFIDPEEEQVRAAAAVGFDACELHTGRYARSFGVTPGMPHELDRLSRCGALIVECGMQFNAGHALDYGNVGPVAALPKLSELHIGHSIVSRAVFSGLRSAVAEMKRRIAAGDAGRGG